MEPPSFSLTCRAGRPLWQASRQTCYCRLRGVLYQMHLKKGLELEAFESPRFRLMGKKGGNPRNGGISSGHGVGESI